MQHYCGWQKYAEKKVLVITCFHLPVTDLSRWYLFSLTHLETVQNCLSQDLGIIQIQEKNPTLVIYRYKNSSNLRWK